MRTPAFGFLALGTAFVLAQPALSQTASLAELAHRRSVYLLEGDPTLRYDPTTVIVRFRTGAAEAERAALRRLVGGFGLRSLDAVPGLELISTSIPVDEAIALLRPHVEYAEHNWVVQKDSTIPNDTYFGLQWGIHNTGQTILGTPGTPDADIDGVEAWDVSTGDAGFAVAIIDTGTQWNHPDLDANIWSNPGEIAGNGLDDDGNGYVDDIRGWDFYSGDNNPTDGEGHGTHTAGTVGAEGDNGVGVAGVNWRCKLAPLRFLGPSGGFTSDAIAAVNYCTIEGIRVSNNSWGGGGYSQGLYDAIDASKSVGHVFVAAAGNSGVNTDVSPHYPSSYNLSNLISVAATDNRDALANESTWASNYGASSVDLGAPGVDIASTWSGSGYVWAGGTSMATPHVAGVAALVYARNPGWSYAQVVGRILSTARPAASMAGRCTTGGILNAFDAVDTGGGGDTTPPAPPTGLSATAGDASVSLDWNDNGEPDFDSYRVLRSTTSGTGYGEIASGITASAYVDNGVTNGVTYYYVVRAEDTSGNVSGNSNEASATPSGGGGGGPQVLFSDGFESGNFSAGGWTIQNGDSFISTGADRTGAYGARIRRTSWIERAVSTAGYSSIQLAYSRRTSGMDSGEFLWIEYWNGTSWVAVESTRSTGWADRTMALGADAGNESGFKIRFRTNANRTNERADVDDVEVVGTP